MKQQYIVAQNLFTVSTPGEGLAAWRALDSHFGPFEVATADEPVMQVEIRVGELPANDGTMIYEPEHNDIGIVEACAWRQADGSLTMVFKHAAEPSARLWMKMSPELNKADIVLAPGGDSDDAHFVTHAVMIAYLLATAGNGTLLIHASSVMLDGKAYLFQGKSGTGKSTHAALWTRYLPGAELLNDDHPVIRFTPDGVATVYGSPWSGKTDCYRNLSAPVGAFVRIVRDSENRLERLPLLKAYASLTASVFYLPFLSEELRETRHMTIERLVGSVPCCEMHCRPDRDAAITCHRSIHDSQCTIHDCL